MCLIREKISISHYIYDRKLSVLTTRRPGQEMCVQQMNYSVQDKNYVLWEPGVDQIQFIVLHANDE